MGRILCFQLWTKELKSAAERRSVGSDKQNLFRFFDKNGRASDNKSAQNNLGKGPRLSAVAHVRRKVPHWLQWRAPNSPPKVPLPMDRSPQRIT